MMNKNEKVLEALRQGPKTTYQLQLHCGSSNVRSVIHSLRQKGFLIKAVRLPSYGEESVVYQYHLTEEVK